MHKSVVQLDGVVSPGIAYDPIFIVDDVIIHIEKIPEESEQEGFSTVGIFQ